MMTEVTLEEMKDKFLIQMNDLFHVPDEIYVRKKTLNYGITKKDDHGILGTRFDALPWGLDGLWLYMEYNTQINRGVYYIYPRFRLCGETVVTFVSMSDQIFGVNAILNKEIIEAESINEFLSIMQECIDNSSIQLMPEMNRYDLTFMGSTYSVSENVNEDGCYVNIDRFSEDDGLNKRIQIRPICHNKEMANFYLDCAITENKKTATAIFKVEENSN